MKCKLAFALWTTTILLVVSPAVAQQKINDKIELTTADLPADAPAELKLQFDEFCAALVQELKAQAGSFRIDRNLRVLVKLMIKPKSMVVEITLDPGRTAPPRITTTAFARKVHLGEEGFKEAIKSSAKLILTLAANC